MSKCSYIMNSKTTGTIIADNIFLCIVRLVIRGLMHDGSWAKHMRGGEVLEMVVQSNMNLHLLSMQTYED
jgi:hypothetical protein